MSKAIPNSLFTLRLQFLGFIQRRVNDRAIAEDILQTAYLRALQSTGNLRQHESAVAWFYRILRNSIIDHYRRRATEGAALERWADELKQEQIPNMTLEETTCLCIAGAIETMHPSYSGILREVELEGVTLSHYASAHGITTGNATVRAHRARAALRKQLIECCGTCSTHGCQHCTCIARKAEETA